MNSVMWTCIVHEGDAKFLPSYLSSVLAQNHRHIVSLWWIQVHRKR